LLLFDCFLELGMEWGRKKQEDAFKEILADVEPENRCAIVDLMMSEPEGEA